MLNYEKQDIRDALTTEDIFELLIEWGGEPQYSSTGIISRTIDHNPAGEGSFKLYYYENSGLFTSYTAGDDSFDIFELTIKVFEIQKNQQIDLNEAIRFIAFRFGISGSFIIDSDNELEDWAIFHRYEKIQQIEVKQYDIQLKSYDKSILNVFNYKTAILPWLEENISQEVMTNNQIGYYPGGEQITIPHFDEYGRLIGIRGRTLCKEDAEIYGKYRPLVINKQMYNHPLGMALYNFNNSKRNITAGRRAIVFEGEKSCLKYQSYLGKENDISVACCGSNISNYQMNLLLECRVREVVIALDRQFKELGDDEFMKLKKSLLKLHKKYNNYTQISFIFDKEMRTGYKDSPIDKGIENFVELFKERIIL